MTPPDPGKAAATLLATIVQMSDEAQAKGGATSITGVASLHRMQSSIQKNRKRIIDTCQLVFPDDPA